MVSPQAPIASPFGYRSTAREVVGGIDLSGKRVVVTGGYSGIGTETVRALAGAGAHIIVGARRPDQAQDVLSDMAGEIAVLPLDLSDPASIDSFAEAVAGRWDAIDILINNAGGPPPGDFKDLSLDDWRKAVEWNMITPIALIKSTVYGMMDRGFGRIVNISSRSLLGRLDGSVYAAAKAGAGLAIGVGHAAFLSLGRRSITSRASAI